MLYFICSAVFSRGELIKHGERVHSEFNGEDLLANNGIARNIHVR